MWIHDLRGNQQNKIDNLSKITDKIIVWFRSFLVVLLPLLPLYFPAYLL